MRPAAQGHGRTGGALAGLSWWSAAREHILRVTLVAAIVAMTAALADVAMGDGARPSPRGFVWTLEVGLGFGAVSGLVIGAVQAGLAPRRAVVTWGLWAALGGALACWLVADLGALARLGTPDHRQAVLAIAASAGAGVGLFAVAFASQPRGAHPRGRLASLPRRRLLGSIAVALGGAALLAWVDRAVHPGSYQGAHATLQSLTLAVIVVAVLAAIPRWVPRTGGAWALVWVALVGLSIDPLVTLTRGRESERALEAMVQRPIPRLAITALRALGDPDRDGVSGVLGGGDCDSFNAQVRPGVAEIPGNGIDDNCLLGDAPAPVIEAAAEIPTPDTPSPMSVIVITVDSVAAPRLGLYGAERDTSPGLGRWAKDAAVFERGFTSGGWTSLAISSMFRGVYARRLRWTRLYETNKYKLLRASETEGAEVRKLFALPIEDPRATLPWLLQRRGMYTAAVVDDGITGYMEEGSGLVTGFDEYVHLDDFPKNRRDDQGVTDEALRVLDAAPGDRPLFLWVHYFGPHTPDTRHRGVRYFGNRPKDRYDHELLFWDQQVSRLLARVDALARARPITVIVAADHGEIFIKRGRFHGIFPNETALRIPLVMKGPGIEPGRYENVASLVDVMPTVLALTGTPGPASLDGVDLRDVMAGAVPEVTERLLLFDTWHLRVDSTLERDYVVAMDGDHKFVWNRVLEARALRRQGPTERRKNLIGQVDDSRFRERVTAYVEQHGALDLHD